MTKFIYVDTNKEYMQAVQVLYGADRLALDTETYSLEQYKSYKECRLNPHTGRISILTLLKEGSLPYVFDLIKLEKEGYNDYFIKEVLKTAGYLLIHNAKFDAAMLRGQFGIRLRNLRCTLILAQLLSNATGSKFGKAKGHSLADLCRDLLDLHLEGKGSLQLNDWGISIEARSLDNPIWLEMLTYAANDVCYLFELHDILYSSLTNPLPNTPLLQAELPADTAPGLGLKELVDLEMNYISAVVEKEYNGLPANLSCIRKIQDYVGYAVDEAAAELCKELGLETYIPDIDSGEVPSPTSEKVLNNPTKMAALLKTKLNINLDNSQSKMLERLLDIIESVYGGELELVTEDEQSVFTELKLCEHSSLVESSNLLKLFLKFKKLQKQKSMDLRQYINPASGRIHSRYSSLGAATGRLCVARGEKVITPQGLRKIEDFAPGLKVYSHTRYGLVTEAVVTNVWDKGLQETITLEFSNLEDGSEQTSLRCTKDHLIKTIQSIWVEANNLREGDLVFGLVYKDGLVKQTNYLVTNKKYNDRKIKVYDIEVPQYHNFYASGICCHNSSSGPNAQQISARLETYIEVDPDDFTSD